MVKDPQFYSQWIQCKFPDTGFNSSFLHEAIEEGEPEIVNAILENPHIDPSSDENSAIIFAVSKDRRKIVERLLQDPRVDPSAQNNRAINEAESHGYTDIIPLLLNDRRVQEKAA